MRPIEFANFAVAIYNAEQLILTRSRIVHSARWQGADIADRPEMATHEVTHVSFGVNMAKIKVPSTAVGATLGILQDQIKPNLPWADDHFEERVCGEPINPGVEWANWPYNKSASTFLEPCWGPDIPPQDWAYLAGMIDGDGTIYFRNKERWQGVIRVYQVDPMICHHIHKLFGVGKVVSNNEKTKTNIHGKVVNNHCWLWQVNAQKEAKWLLEGLKPYLVVKKEKAIEALRLIDHSIANPPKTGTTQTKVWGRDWEPRFNHNYMSRYWPRGENNSPYLGLKYKYGDLNDVVNLLASDPYTRQAYLPVWFPEDTGGGGKRAPCSIGYHFLMRDGYLDVEYQIRSCDYLRHFRDDIYLTVRLLLWVLNRCRALDERWQDVSPGRFFMQIGSLHVFRNDFIVLSAGQGR